MTTQCKSDELLFQVEGQRPIVAKFDGGTIASDGGMVLLSQVERKTGILERFARCFTDYRDPERTEHSVSQLIKQRIFGLCLGYEDLNDHDQLRADPLLATVVGKRDPTGKDRQKTRDCGKPLAGKSTLNRLELTPARASAESRYKKIVVSHEAVNELFLDLFLDSFATPPEQLTLDFDATDDPVHGNQLGRFFHGYYKCYCYLPLYVFCGAQLLCARLRPSNLDASAGSLSELQRIVGRIRARWPQVRILVRGDGGFCREHLMAWCESNRVDFLFGLPKNTRLEAEIAAELAQAAEQYAATKTATRIFKEFEYQTLDSWTRARRVVAKAEHLAKGSNPRFVVTSLSANERASAALYEQDYCARGDMENRIKEQQLHLFADRTSASTMRANQLRLWFSSIAYVLLEALRRLGLKETVLERAQCQTIRLRLLKIGALVQVTVRNIWLRLSQSFPFQDLFRDVAARLSLLPDWPRLPVQPMPTKPSG